MDDTWSNIKSQAFTKHINSVNSYVKFTREDTKNRKLPFLDCEVLVENDGGLVTEVYRKPTNTTLSPPMPNWASSQLYNTTSLPKQKGKRRNMHTSNRH